MMLLSLKQHGELYQNLVQHKKKTIPSIREIEKKDTLMIDITPETKAIIASYARSVLGAAVATYTATQDWKLTLNALWAAALPVAMRFLNPNDHAFGKKQY
jgi:hypothetical protein